MLDYNAEGSYSQVIEGLKWAMDNQVNIVSMSFGGKNYSQALAEAMSLAKEKGILLFAAAGNDGVNELDYPAKFNSVISVGAVNNEGVRLEGSNTGNELQFVGRGQDVSGYSLQGEIIVESGTSAATAQAASIAALYWSNLSSLQPDALLELLKTNANSLGSLEEYGYGLIEFVMNKQKNTDKQPSGVDHKADNKPTIEENPPSDFSVSEDLEELGRLKLEVERNRLELDRALQAE
ncbi:Minor extracellular protease Epr precursor [compost metagenome]